MNIASRLVDRAAQAGEAPALIDVAHGQPRVTSFAQLDDASARGAALLLALGCQPGDAVVLLHRMSLELYAALVAVFRLGLVAVVPDPSASRAQVAAALEALPLTGFIGGRKAHLLRWLHPSLRASRWAVSLDGWVPAARSWRASHTLAPYTPVADVAADAPALVTFTSGSTSVPKVAVRSHGFLLAQHDVLERTLQLRPGDVDLSTLPVFVLANLASGVTSVIPDADLRRPGQIAPGPVIAQVMRHLATRTAASPGLLGRLVEECERTGTTLPLSTVHVGGAPVFPRLLDAVARAAPGARVVCGLRLDRGRADRRDRPRRHHRRRPPAHACGRRPGRRDAGARDRAAHPEGPVASGSRGRAHCCRVREPRGAAWRARGDRGPRRPRASWLLPGPRRRGDEVPRRRAGLASHRRRRLPRARRPAVAARPLPGAGRGRPRRALSLFGRVRRHALRGRVQGGVRPARGRARAAGAARCPVTRPTSRRWPPSSPGRISPRFASIQTSRSIAVTTPRSTTRRCRGCWPPRRRDRSAFLTRDALRRSIGLLGSPPWRMTSAAPSTCSSRCSDATPSTN